MKPALLFLWQLPQNCIGFLLTKFFRCNIFFFNFGDTKIKAYVATVRNLSWSGVSLGGYIIIAGNRFATETTLRHESGHQVQSRRLGWLYLLIIGLPSLCGNIADRVFHKKWSVEKRIEWYYKKQPWEKSADRLGGVKR